MPCETSNDAVVSRCCWTSGAVSATMSLNKRCYVPGETIFINAEINNNSRTDVKRTRASLKQVCLEMFLRSLLAMLGVGSTYTCLDVMARSVCLSVCLSHGCGLQNCCNYWDAIRKHKIVGPRNHSCTRWGTCRHHLVNMIEWSVLTSDAGCCCRYGVVARPSDEPHLNCFVLSVCELAGVVLVLTLGAGSLKGACHCKNGVGPMLK